MALKKTERVNTEHLLEMKNVNTLMSGVQKLLVIQVHTHQGQGGRKGRTFTSNMNEWVNSLFVVGGDISKEETGKNGL